MIPDKRVHHHSSNRGTRRLPAIFILLCLVCAAPDMAIAYHKDSHYFLRFTLSLATCYNWDEAHLIASGDWGMDENSSTHAEMNPVQKDNKINWHAFGHSDKRFQELWLRTLQEPDFDVRLIKLGQFMHFLEDWEAHAGYGIRLGHARDTFRGRDPDSLGNSKAKNHRMIQSALDHLLATCESLGRQEGDRDLDLVRIMKLLYVDGLLADLYEASETSWKKGTMGGLRPEGKRIQLANKTRLEEFIEQYIRPDPNAGIPADFEPGTQKGIPPSLQIPFNQDGSIADLRTDLEQFRAAAGEESAADVVLTIDQARAYFRDRSASERGGWHVDVSAFNAGAEGSKEGNMEIVVIDSEDETVVTQSSQVLPALEPGETRAFRINLTSRNRPETDVIIAAYARGSDLSATNDQDWLMLGDAEEEEPEVAIVTDIDPQPEGEETISIPNPPKMFVLDSTACILVSAIASGGDSTEKLDQGTVRVVGGSLDEYHYEKIVPSRWSAFATQDGLVGGKTFACFVPEQAAVEEFRKQDPATLEIEVTIEADEIESASHVYPVPESFYEAFIEL